MRAGIARTQTGGSPIPPRLRGAVAAASAAQARDLSLVKHTAREAEVNRRTGTATGTATADFTTEHTESTENDKAVTGERQRPPSVPSA